MTFPGRRSSTLARSWGDMASSDVLRVPEPCRNAISDGADVRDGGSQRTCTMGHELGCHTFGHCHSWNTPPDMYERAILDNQQALNEVLPGTAFQTFSYPFSGPRLSVKQAAGRRFLAVAEAACVRDAFFSASRGRETFNSGTKISTCFVHFSWNRAAKILRRRSAYRSECTSAGMADSRNPRCS